jgi:hypothetical protein
MSVLGKVKTILNALVRRGYWYDNIFLPDARKFQVYSTFNTKLVNLGSTSAVAAFDYSGLPVKAANWALRRNPLAGDWAVLRNYSSYLDAKDSTVIIPLCPFSALSGDYEPFEDRYYSVLYPSTIPGYSYVQNVQAQDKITNPIMHYPWYGIFVDLWHLCFKGNAKSMKEEEMAKDALNRINGWLKEFAMEDFNTPLSLWNKDNISSALEHVQNIIVFCRERNITAVLTVPPVYKTLSDKFSKEAKDLLFGGFEGIAKKNGVTFINYMTDSQFMNERTLFRDSYLMNKNGARIFTKRILTDLKLI